MSWQPKKWVLACRDGVRFEVCFGFTIRDISPLSISPPSCVSKLGNTSKCYPHSSAATSSSSLHFLILRSSPFVSLKHFPPLMGRHQSTCHGSIWSCLLSATRKARLSLQRWKRHPCGQCLWPSLGDMLPQVRWKRKSNLEPKATQAAIWSTLLTNRATHLALLSSCPSSQKRHLHIPEKKILSWVETIQWNIGSVTHVLPRKELCVWRVYSVMVMFSS